MPSSFKNQTINNNKENKMKKALVALLSIAIAFTALAPAQAQDQKVLAIIDTAINSKNFPSIIHEACVTSVKAVSSKMACPNGQKTMEGPGAAAAPWPTGVSGWQNNATYHGDRMVKAALVSNPNIKIVFVRYADVNSKGNSINNPDALVEAIKWVSENASKYSIDAVSISQSSVSKNNLDACNGTGTLAREGLVAINAISFLNASNIPVFVATGNDRRRDVVGFPSCINGAIGVGALWTDSQLELETNTGPGLDMVELGKWTIVKIDGQTIGTSGSSVAAVVSAASYVNRNTFKTFGEYLASLKKITINTVSYIRN